MTDIYVTGAGSTPSRLEVFEGRALVAAITETEQQLAAASGDGYNLNTGELTLTSDAETPLFYIRNDGAKNIKVPRIFLTMLQSTGGTGAVRAGIYYNITGGTILTASDLEVFNFNAGSLKPSNTTNKLGATGLTFSGGVKPIKSLYTGDNFRTLNAFDHIVLPPQTSILFTVTPPSGNTSVIVLAGCNIFKQELKNGSN